MKKMFYKAIIKLIEVSKQIGYENEIKEENGLQVLFLKKKKNKLSDLLMIPLNDKSLKPLKFYEKARKQISEEYKWHKKEIRLKKIVSKIEESKVLVEQRILDKLSKEDKELYLRWKINKKIKP